MSKTKSYAILGLLLFVGLLIRLYHNTDISLWHDEAFSALLIRYPWGEMFYRIGLDVHPPAYYVALRLWHYVLGDSLLALRGFSVFFGLATAWAGYLLVKSMTKESLPGLITAAFILFNPFQIEYATEARMYTFGAFLAVFAAYLLVKALESSKLDAPKLKQAFFWTSFGLAASLAALTHYYLLFSVAALCLYGLLYHIYHFRTKVKSYFFLLASYVLIALVFLPWLQWFFFQYKQVGAGYWIPPMTKWSIPTTLWQILIGTGVDIQKFSSQLLVTAITILVIIILGLLIKSKIAHKWMLIFGFLAPFGGSFLFLLLALLKGSNSSVYLVRYFLYASGFLSAILALVLTQLRYKKIATILAIALVAINIYTYNNYWQELKISEKTGMATIAKLLIQEVKPEDKLLVASSFEYFNLKYYLASPSRPSISLTTSTPDQRTICISDCLEFSKTPRPFLYSGGKTSIKQMSHFEGTAILTDSDLYPNFNDVPPQTTVWLVWTNGFGGSKPQIPASWTEVNESQFAEIRPYVGTWIYVTKYFVN
jgi:uncharacterized membrane protein